MGHYNGAATTASVPSITLSQESEVRYWTRELGVDEALLRRAIACVGANEIGVRDYLVAACRRLRRDTARRVALAESGPTIEPIRCPG